MLITVKWICTIQPSQRTPLPRWVHCASKDFITHLIGHFGKYHNTLCLTPRILYKHCLCFLLKPLYVPRETANNAHSKFGGKTEYYGIFRSGLLWLFQSSHQQMQNLLHKAFLCISFSCNFNSYFNQALKSDWLFCFSLPFLLAGERVWFWAENNAICELIALMGDNCKEFTSGF